MEEPTKHYAGGAIGRREHVGRNSNVSARKILFQKKGFHPGRIWWEALCDFRSELHEHVERAKKDQLRFQTGRLFSSLIKRIKAEATGKDQWVAMLHCYRFVIVRSPRLGYKEARRLHGEEMAANGLSSPHSFCFSLVESLDELLLRVRSIASWMEAQVARDRVGVRQKPDSKCFNCYLINRSG